MVWFSIGFASPQHLHCPLPPEISARTSHSTLDPPRHEDKGASPLHPACFSSYLFFYTFHNPLVTQAQKLSHPRFSSLTAPHLTSHQVLAAVPPKHHDFLSLLQTVPGPGVCQQKHWSLCKSSLLGSPPSGPSLSSWVSAQPPGALTKMQM